MSRVGVVQERSRVGVVPFPWRREGRWVGGWATTVMLRAGCGRGGQSLPLPWSERNLETSGKVVARGAEAVGRSRAWRGVADLQFKSACRYRRLARCSTAQVLSGLRTLLNAPPGSTPASLRLAASPPAATATAARGEGFVEFVGAEARGWGEGGSLTGQQSSRALQLAHSHDSRKTTRAEGRVHRNPRVAAQSASMKMRHRYLDELERIWGRRRIAGLRGAAGLRGRGGAAAHRKPI